MKANMKVKTKVVNEYNITYSFIESVCLCNSPWLPGHPVSLSPSLGRTETTHYTLEQQSHNPSSHIQDLFAAKLTGATH